MAYLVENPDTQPSHEITNSTKTEPDQRKLTEVRTGFKQKFR
jgi:hypothetical protein